MYLDNQLCLVYHNLDKALGKTSTFSKVGKSLFTVVELDELHSDIGTKTAFNQKLKSCKFNISALTFFIASFVLYNKGLVKLLKKSNPQNYKSM